MAARHAARRRRARKKAAAMVAMRWLLMNDPEFRVLFRDTTSIMAVVDARRVAPEVIAPQQQTC